MLKSLRKADPKMKRLANLKPFRSSSEKELSIIASALDETSFPAGAIIMEQGSVGREFYIIEHGLASVSINNTPVAVLGPGEIIGEMAVIATVPRSATVTARTEVKAFVGPAHLFEGVVHDAPVFGLSVLATVIERLRAAEGGPTEFRSLRPSAARP
ncbi:MAG: cyclic nucleotide-binding domain-containing protein [Actinomycetota bacterium]